MAFEGMAKPLSFPGERILLAARRHWFVLFFPLLFITLISLAAIGGISFVFIKVFPSFPFLILSLLGVLELTFAALVQTFVNWNTHMYVITSHKILELCMIPLGTHSTNGVLLDQVRCTEVDVKINGILNQYLDMGDITITFDRPTHQEDFTLSDIPNPNQAGALLSDELDIMRHAANEQQSWFKSKKEPHKVRYTEELQGFGFRHNNI